MSFKIEDEADYPNVVGVVIVDQGGDFSGYLFSKQYFIGSHLSVIEKAEACADKANGIVVGWVYG